MRKRRGVERLSFRDGLVTLNRKSTFDDDDGECVDDGGMGILCNRQHEAVGWLWSWTCLMLAVFMLCTVGMLLTVFGSEGMFGYGESLEQMVHPMRCR